MNILQKNMGAAKNQDMTADLLTILNLPPEKLAQLTTSMEKNILNGALLIINKKIIKSFLFAKPEFSFKFLLSLNPFFSDARPCCISRNCSSPFFHFQSIRLIH